MKKALSMVLLLSMLAGMFSVGIAAQDYVVDDSYTLGDVNGDGESNALDAWRNIWQARKWSSSSGVRAI